MRPAGIAFVILSAIMLVTGCTAAGSTPPLREASDSSGTTKETDNTERATTPRVVFAVANTYQAPVKDSSELKENPLVEAKVTIKRSGRWRVVGDLERSGQLTQKQARRWAALVRSDAFMREMAHPPRQKGIECAAVVPPYTWTLKVRGHTVNPDCAMRIPTIAKVVNLIENYTGVCRDTTIPGKVADPAVARRKCTRS